MNPERWQAVGEIFEQALGLPDGERTAWVEERGGSDAEVLVEVKSLLVSHREAGGGFFQEKVRDAVVAFHRAGEATGPRRAGPYRLVRELGRGGMGTVFLAERDDAVYQAQVAVKLVRPGMDTEFILARFRRERQTLARLHHPNIAQLLDGGTTEEGLPYIVMEYVNGLRLTEHARQHSLSIEARLKLFVDVCSAVDCAHRNFVVHRDLKPGNILVDESGAPKLLDFGICKLLEVDPVAQNDATVAPLTPDYASPEQIRGEPITPLSDLYSLGIVLYELLSGKLPERFTGTSPWSLEVRESPPDPPSSADRKLAGDLDNIVLRALETQPERRYQTVAQLAEDIRRYLAHQPVLARPATVGYRMSKFIRRNYWPVAAVLALVVALGVSLYQWNLARRRLQMVRGLAEKLVVDIHDSVSNLPGATAARQTIVATGLQYLDAASKAARGDAQSEQSLAVAYRKLGDAQGYVVSSNLGNTKGALESYAKAKQLLDDAARREPELDQAERVIVRERIASMQIYMGRTKDAIAGFDEAARIGKQALQQAKSAKLEEALAVVHVQASDAHRGAGDWASALREAKQAVDLYRSLESEHPLTPEMRHGLATAYASMGMAEARASRPNESLEWFRQDVAEMEKLTQANPHNVTWQRDLILAYGHVGDQLGLTAYTNLGDPVGALAAYRKGAGMARVLYESDPNNLRAVMDYGIVTARAASVMEDKNREKLVLAREAVKLLEQAAHINPGNSSIEQYRAWANQLIGDALRGQGDLAGAQSQFLASTRHAQGILKSGQAAPLGQLAISCRRASENAVALGDRASALQFANAPLAAMDVVTVKTPTMLPRVYSVMGLTYAALAGSRLRQPGDAETARTWLQKAVAASEAAKADPLSVSALKQDMQDVEAALAKLESKR